MVDRIALIGDFAKKSENLKKELREIIEILNEGMAPTEEDSLNLTISMTGIRKTYSEIKAEALSIDPTISGNQTITVYKDIFKKHEASKLREQVNSLVETLYRFTVVISDSFEYQEALKPYQDEALATIRLLQSDQMSIESKLETSCKDQEAFLEAISMDGDELSSHEGEGLLDILDACYSRKVMRGVLLGLYKEPALHSEVSSPTSAGKLPDTTSLDNSDIQQADALCDSGTIERLKAGNEDGRRLNVPVESSTKGEEAVAGEDSAVIDGIEANNVKESDTGLESQTHFLRSRNNVKKPGKVSATSFKKDLLSMPLMVRYILPLLTKFGAMSGSHVLAMTSMLIKDWKVDREDEVNRALDALAKKSVIASFDTEEYGDVYVLTTYGRSLLDKASIQQIRSPKANKSFWRLPIFGNEFVSDDSVSESVLLAAINQSDLLVQYLATIRENQALEGLINTYIETEYISGKFKVPVVWGYQDFKCFLCSGDTDTYPEDGAVFVSREGLIPCIDMGASGNAFLANGATLMKWDGSWVKEGECSSEEIGDDIAGNMFDSGISIGSIDEKDGSALGQEKRDSNSEIPSDEDESTPEDGLVNLDKIESIETISVEAREEKAICGSLGAECAENDGSLLDRIERMAEQSKAPTDDEFVAIAKELLLESTPLIDSQDDFSNLVGAITLLAAAATIQGNRKSKLLLDQLSLATEFRVEQIESTGSTIGRSFPGYTTENEALVFSAYCLALFAPQLAYDYDLNNAADMFLGNFEEFFPSLIAFKPLLNELNGIREISPDKGFSDNVLDMIGNQARHFKRLVEMKKKATDLLNPPKIKAKLHGIPEFNAACFGKDSELNLCMQIIEEDKRDDAEFVREVLSAYCAPGEHVEQIDKSIIESRIDDEWHAAIEGKSTSRIRKLTREPRKKALDGFYDRLELMRQWLSYDDGKVDESVLSKLKKKRDSLASIVDELIGAGSLSIAGEGTIVLTRMLKVLKDKLDSNEAEQADFASLLKTGFISLDDRGNPVIDPALNRIPYFEPWRNAMRHLTGSFKPLEEVRALVLDDSSELFDNLRQVSHINKLLNEEALNYKITDAHFEQAEKAAEDATEKFQDSLEIAYAYGLINEIQKENLATSVALFKEDFFARRDYGCWRRFLAALNRQVDDMSAPQGEELRIRLENHKKALKHGASSALLDEAERLLMEEKNYTVVEDYLNRYEAGQTELTSELGAKLHDPDLFSEFISDEVFKPLYDICIKSKGAPLSSFGKNYLKSRYPSEWTSRQRESSENLISSWPINPKRFKEDTLKKLMKSIGFNVRGVEQVKKEVRELYRVTVKPEVSDRTDYRHPISAFGTQIQSPINVLVLNGNYTPQEIIDVVAAESIVGIAIVFINYPISLAARRQMAEIFHTQKSRLTSFLLIDQVLALHLALHQETERMPLMLKCTLPFTYYQPFVRDGGPTADEMFCGRERELQTIIDPNGASVVYGGRQLGKTALLERAKSLRMKPDNKEYAVYVSILNCDSEESAALAISEAMARAGLSFPECRSLREVCKGIDANMREGVISRMLLLIDESDKFLASISEEDYGTLQPMVDLKRETKNNFKFVLAGLHNVSRMKNATTRNGIFGQLGEPLCIKPLTPNEALQLISRPLTYLGFQVDRYPHLETILTSTNYYPGILQFFGNTLVETMTKQYGDYYRAADGNPPYTLHREQLGAIMNRSDLNNSIKEKFRWSLELDPRYFMIARCIALLYYDNDGQPDGIDIQEGFRVEEIKEWADDLSVYCLEKETQQSYVNLLDEMVDMGILVRPAQEVPRYRLRRNSFLNIIGSSLDAVLDDIENNNTVEG